jgi:hypothetical protein
MPKNHRFAVFMACDPFLTEFGQLQRQFRAIDLFNRLELFKTIGRLYDDLNDLNGLNDWNLTHFIVPPARL